MFRFVHYAAKGLTHFKMKVGREPSKDVHRVKAARQALPMMRTMFHAQEVDVLLADATRCGGISNFLKSGFLYEAQQLSFSSHCAPAMHLHASLSLPSFYIAGYFHDHERIKSMQFDGVSSPDD